MTGRGHVPDLEADHVADFELTRTFTDADRAALSSGETDPFHTGELDLTWVPKAFHVLARDERGAVAHVGFLLATVDAGGERVEVGGIGGVITRRDARGRGLARAALAFAERVLRERDVAFGMLFCRPALVPFYAAQGWAELAGTVQVDQPGGPRAFPARTMVKALAGRAWPAGPVRVEGLPW